MALPPLPSVVHPLMVHFTVALVPVTAAFAVAFAWKGIDWTRKATYALLSVVGSMALLTMASGFRDYFRVKPGLEGTPALDLLETHELLGIITALTVIITTLIAWWRRRDVATKMNWRLALAIALVAAVFLAFTAAWFGGSLVYDNGVSVHDVTPNA